MCFPATKTVWTWTRCSHHTYGTRVNGILTGTCLQSCMSDFPTRCPYCAHPRAADMGLPGGPARHERLLIWTVHNSSLNTAMLPSWRPHTDPPLLLQLEVGSKHAKHPPYCAHTRCPHRPNTVTSCAQICCAFPTTAKL